ncbi:MULTISPECIES: hypothetical protein [Ramlibacter]|uniref:Uncharacterized protein n=1 Tax=Ramlibacter pinisoli TaxID=2682844 RepID=A0A6N8ISQ8_9BURK|nr:MULTISPECIES: hypothetical protein [Ramlibacter]MBA2964994.1 hypothetical protein [Ramlibacter sp. CGMCC 1.13660]MVQ29959.1 hypothetical protein [Ramlibacter pinisoli]
MNTPPSPEITGYLNKITTREDLEATRTLHFAAAGASLAIILLIAQIGVQKTSQLVSLASASVALPVWLSMGFRDQLWMWMKLTSPALLRVPLIRVIHNTGYLVG